jgi:hypothetical protein
MRGHPRKGKSRGISWSLIPILKFSACRLNRGRRIQCCTCHRCRVDARWDMDSCVVAILLHQILCLWEERAMWEACCVIVNVSVCVTFSFLKRGESWITPNIIPTHLLTWNTILTHRPVIARNSKYSFNFTGGGSDHRDYTASLQSIPDLSVGFWEFPEACIMIISQPQKSSKNKLAPLHHSRPTALINFSTHPIHYM